MITSRFRPFALPLVLLACNKPAPAAVERKPPDPPPAVDVRQRDGLLFTYLDETGAVQSTERIAAIPEARRQNVRVIDLSLSPEQRGAGKWTYVADLRQPKPDGSYPYQVLSQVSFERAVSTQAMSEKVSDALTNASTRVTIYTTQWCGVCSKAKAFLKAKNVPFVERDVEQDASAQVELQEKAKRARVQPQGVPVIDVYGQLMLGFDEARLNALLKRETL